MRPHERKHVDTYVSNFGVVELNGHWRIVAIRIHNGNPVLPPSVRESLERFLKAMYDSGIYVRAIQVQPVGKLPGALS